MKESNKPYVILSAAMTIDGKIATKKGDSELSDKADWKEVHKLRTQVDAIMVGKGTILKDNPKLHIKYYNHRGYYRLVLDSNLTIPLDSNVISFQQEIYPTIICTTENVPLDKIKKYEDKGVKIINVGDDKRVNLIKLLPILKNLGINTILLEGGGNLNWSFIENNLINEIRLTIAPWIVGGKEATSLVEGIGFEKIVSAPRFELFDVKVRTYYITLRYKRK
ncbi:MAG: 2,5-diamino-6-(ribosylamino)-4(3H)-pyrimidinone 5'-phosphate reductase [Promethearchaeota archaeon]|nr:2,5-diamino-6-(ribosylamino)-4(3H)-pyrimidinone 5'-phosphate reductase [Candidatus Lokiarchaeota archaeon]TET57470.1 MAG: 2,5-diamino-6-(ribosylamino)-4(3H)-pyrimidinone 5'-phosphate reductase [Candidatus Lokiarchaeota archaeon]